MSSKTVKVTNGKILNYKISASGYKTIYGSQVITADTTINKNMIAEVDPNGVYSFGDRIGNMATFVSYFNTTNPETNVDQKYAVFILDAQYRKQESNFASTVSVTVPNLINYVSASDVQNSTESATFDNDCYVAASSSLTFYQINNCRNISIILGNNTYYAQLPTIPELLKIRELGSQIDAKDPTVSSYSSMSATTFGGGTAGVCSSQYTTTSPGGTKFWFLANGTSAPNIALFINNKSLSFPVFEIPVE